MPEKELLLFQIGPVQEFIAQAATVEDLWAGSYLLSRLMWSGIEKAAEMGAEFIFPNLVDGTIKAALTGSEKIPTIPNRFLAEVESGAAKGVAAEVSNAIREQLESFAAIAELPDGGKKQIDQFLLTTWAVLPASQRSVSPKVAMKDDYATISGMLAARRNLRDFRPWCESVPTGPKDFLSGKETALAKKRGAVNLIKLALPECENKTIAIKYPDDDKYIAVVAMDGDTMGKRLSEFESVDDHRKFSGALAKFAVKAIDFVKANGGSPIYVGGDDVLAVFPAKQAVNGARELYKTFVELVGGTASAGVAVGHEKSPMQELVRAAQEAEHRAKHDYGRDALAIDVLKRSGENVIWGGKWNSAGIDILIDFRGIMDGDMFKRFPYKLAALLDPYELEKLSPEKAKEMSGVISAEYSHAWTQCTGHEVEDVALDLVNNYFQEVVAGRTKAKDFLSVFRTETFINRPRDIREDD